MPCNGGCSPPRPPLRDLSDAHASPNLGLPLHLTRPRCTTRHTHPSSCASRSPATQGLPRRYLQSEGTGASAAVVWDAASETAYIVFEGTDTEADWVQDLLVSQSSDFRPTGADVFQGVAVHQGFLNQFQSLTDAAPRPEENITAVVLDMSGGLVPRRVVAAGGGAGAWG